MERHRLAPLLVILILLVLWGCASGSAIVTGTVRAATTPEQVTIYLEPPAEFEVVGLVNASSDARWTEQGSVDYAIQELKEQAAKLGANGVLLVSTGERTTTTFIASGSVLHPVPVTGEDGPGKSHLCQAEVGSHHAPIPLS